MGDEESRGMTAKNATAYLLYFCSSRKMFNLLLSYPMDSVSNPLKAFLVRAAAFLLIIRRWMGRRKFKIAYFSKGIYYIMIISERNKELNRGLEKSLLNFVPSISWYSVDNVFAFICDLIFCEDINIGNDWTVRCTHGRYLLLCR